MILRTSVLLSVLGAFVIGAAAMLYATAEDRRTLDGLGTPFINILTHKKFIEADVKVNIINEGKEIGHGSGVHLGGGRVLTARHVVFKTVVTNSKMMVETRDGKEDHNVEVIWSSPLYDIAMLQVSGMEEVGAATLSCYVPKVGDEVHWVGNILSEDFLTGFGRVGSGYKTDDRVKWRKYFAVYGLVSPGMSGGGVYDSRGKLIGISVGYLGSQEIGDDVLINSGFGTVVPGHALCEIMGR